MVLLIWVCYEAVAGRDLGLAERTRVEAELMWPLVVAVGTAKGGRAQPDSTRPDPQPAPS